MKLGEDFDFDTLLVQMVAPFVVQVTLQRPEVRNAINSIMMKELHTLWVQVARCSQDIRCIVLTGTGDKAFSAGADLKERSTLTLQTWQTQHVVLEQAMLAMLDSPIPILAAVNGAAFGGGLELVLASDFAYAATTARFAQSETKWGLIPAAMGTQRLPRACGLARAKELCFTAETFTAEEALAWGIVNKLCEPQTLLAEILQTAQKIAHNAPLAVLQAKKSLNASQNTDLRTGYFYEIEAYFRTLSSQDREEGIRAFVEKRDPRYSG